MHFKMCFVWLQTISKDSDSLIAESPDDDSEGFDPTMPWWKHPKVRDNWKMVLAALALFLIGLGKFLNMSFIYPWCHRHP